MGAGGKRNRAFSAGYRDKGEMNLLSRPASRGVLTQEWIASLKEKGVIISDAEMRYRKWLSLSNSQQPLLSQVKPPRRPLTAPPVAVTGIFRENKSSKLRKDRLPEVRAEVSYSRLSKQRKEFEKQCRCLSPVTIMTEKFPTDDTSHQFLMGSRYNYSHIVDSRSLSRLGVYVPKGNLAGTFINPAGILPPSNTQYGRVGSVITPTSATITQMQVTPSFLEIHQYAKDTGSSTIPCSSVGDFNVTSDDEGKIADLGSTNAIEQVQNSSIDFHRNEISREVVDDKQLMLTEDAKKLAENIIQESLTSVNSATTSSSSSVSAKVEGNPDFSNGVGHQNDLPQKCKSKSTSMINNKEENNNSVSYSHTNIVSEPSRSLAELKTNTTSENSVANKSSSKLFIDMSQLHISS